MSEPASTLNQLEGERAIPNVNMAVTARWKRGALVLFMIMTLVMAGTVAVLKFGHADNPVDIVEQRTMTRASTVPVRTFAEVEEPEPVFVPEPPPAVLPAVPVEPIVPRLLPPPVALKPIPSREPPKTIDKAASRSRVVDLRSDAVSSARAAPVEQASNNGFFGAPQAASAPSAGENGSLGSQLVATSLKATTARQLQERNFLLTRGGFIDCALDTRLDSTVPGLTSCVVTRDVFSTNGKLVLIERGSRVAGEYRANLRQGMHRLFVLWDRVETPAGVVVDLSSPATDSLGAAGIAGYVDTHFWQRFGGAMLLSLIDDVARAATASASDSDSESARIVVGSTASVSSDLAAEVLRNTINIAPTIHVNQGARVGIFVARDLDFSTVYDITLQ